MKQKRFRSKSILAILSAAALLSGCGSSPIEAIEEISPVVAGETISSDSKWINSDIEGAIDESTKVNLKDDFYTATNRDWLLETTLDEDVINSFSENEDLLAARKEDIVAGNVEISDDNVAGLSKKQLAHTQELLQDFAVLAGDWDTRNDLGVEPIRPYLEAIDNISSMDDMTSYLMNNDKMNFMLLYLINFDVESPFSNKGQNTVMLSSDSSLSLGAASEYMSISLQGLQRKEINNQKVEYLLGRLGYDHSAIQKILRESYCFECRLVDSMTENAYAAANDTDNTYTFDELKTLEGNYPLTDILTRYGLAASNSYTVIDPSYVKKIGKLYTSKYLSEIKSYYTVQTLDALLPLLDRESYEKCTTLDATVKNSSENDLPDTAADTDSAKEKEDADILIDYYVQNYMSEPLDEIYIAKYCTAKEKEDIEKLVDSIVSYYSEMLMNETWLSEATRKKAVEKLDNICIRAVYPDTMTDYTSLSFEEGDSLVDMVASLNDFYITKMQAKVNTDIDRNEWNLASNPTTVANAYYMPSENSINILAGVLANGFMYSEDAEYEVILARIGAIVGHEITHGFDTTGYKYDKDGQFVTWWKEDDISKFEIKSSDLAKYYSALTPYPGATDYDGGKVEGEAIADMGGIKCMLGLAKEYPDFDYDLFFTSYAQMWREKDTYDYESMAASDVHPLAFLRVNVTLQQFDEFNETYDLQPGDGMYIDPDDRILVW